MRNYLFLEILKKKYLQFLKAVIHTSHRMISNNWNTVFRELKWPGRTKFEGGPLLLL